MDDFFTSCSGTAVSGSVATGDTYISGAVYIPLNALGASQGVIVWNEIFNGAFVFTPTPGYNGTVTLNYLVENPDGLYDVGVLTIDVSQMTAQLTAANTVHETCGTANGSATVTHTGGFAPYTYSKNGTDYSNTTGTFT